MRLDNPPATLLRRGLVESGLSHLRLLNLQRVGRQFPAELVKQRRREAAHSSLLEHVHWVRARVSTLS